MSGAKTQCLHCSAGRRNVGWPPDRDSVWAQPDSGTPVRSRDSGGATESGRGRCSRPFSLQNRTFLTSVVPRMFCSSCRESSWMERAYILESSSTLTPENFPVALFRGDDPVSPVTVSAGETLAQARKRVVDHIERVYSAKPGTRLAHRSRRPIPASEEVAPSPSSSPSCRCTGWTRSPIAAVCWPT